MSNVVFSVVASAIRPEFYKKCYDSLSHNNKISFEMIFVGHKPPTEFVGEHFRYIYSTVKPAQCMEIGAREAQGEYIITTGDDVRYSDNFLNNLYDEISIVDTNKYFLSFMGFHAGEIKLGDMNEQMKNYKEYFYDSSILNSPKTGWSGCYPRDLWKKLGGIDRRFIHALFDNDLQMRCYEIGLEYRLAKNIYMREFYPDFGSRRAKEDRRRKWKENKLYNRYLDYSRRLVNSFWVNPDGTMSKKRLLPVELFDDKDIKEITQSEKGEWK